MRRSIGSSLCRMRMTLRSRVPVSLCDNLSPRSGNKSVNQRRNQSVNQRMPAIRAYALAKSRQPPALRSSDPHGALRRTASKPLLGALMPRQPGALHRALAVSTTAIAACPPVTTTPTPRRRRASLRSGCTSRHLCSLRSVISAAPQITSRCCTVSTSASLHSPCSLNRNQAKPSRAFPKPRPNAATCSPAPHPSASQCAHSAAP